MDERALNAKQPRLLITGASGFTGKHACAHLSKAGYHVIAVSRKSMINDNDIQTIRCELTNKIEVEKLIENAAPHFLLHLAGQNHVGNSWTDPIMTLEANVLSTAYLIHALFNKNPSCKMIVIGSALQFNPANISAVPHPYSLSKTLQALVAQAWAILYNMPIVIAKPSNLIGPGFSNGVCSMFAKKIVEMEKNKADKILDVINPQTQRDFLDVRDAVKAYELLLLKGVSGEVYEISSGRNRSIEEMINTFKSLTNSTFEVKSTITESISVQEEVITAKLTTLGWKPAVSFETSLIDTLNFYRNS